MNWQEREPSSVHFSVSSQQAFAAHTKGTFTYWQFCFERQHMQ